MYPGLFSWAIDAPLFFLLCRRIGAIQAMGMAHQAHAVLVGAGMVMGGEKMLPEYKRLVAEAFPDGR